MRITAARAWQEHFELKRPYAIAYKALDAVENCIVELRGEGGLVGLGAASPSPYVTGETPESCLAALAPQHLSWLVGEDARRLPALARELARRLPDAPAARAAVDMALHDLLAQHLGVPLVEMLGRAHDSLPTSITIGIKPPDETVEEAREYLGRGFRYLKVKIGRGVEEDIERLVRLRAEVGPAIRIRVDANQGYAREQFLAFLAAARMLDLELIEQPLPAADVEGMRRLPELARLRIAADECLQSETDAWALASAPRACGIFNIKLMKCGGIRPALRIATIAEMAGIELMWGCMDESIISITAALHAALACPNTAYLDLDGSLDLARDVVAGGFILEDGCLRASAKPGLGLTPLAR